MFNFKIVFFYFLAIKIIFIKFLKQIYFTTRIYNKSLKGKNPKQFHFFPNPLLLSSFVSNNNFSFKITKANADNFWKKSNSSKEDESLNNFYWLNLINRKNDGLTIQKIITLWISNNEKYQKKVWKNSVTSKRVISWILNADVILNNTNVYFKERFFQSILIQVNHLKNNLNYENNPVNKIEIITAILLSGLVFKEYNNNFELGIKELKKTVEVFFDENGCTINRNISDLIYFSKFLILIKECCEDAQEYIPDYLDEIIEKIIICLNSIKTPNNKNPLFNGAFETNMEKYFNYLSGLNYNTKIFKNKIGEIFIFKNKKVSLFFDVGPPPKKKFSNNYQSGPLSFEYYVDNQKIITNCGFGKKISKKTELISRLTSAQSTLCINDTSAVKFERNSLLRKIFGVAIKSSFKTYDFHLNDEKDFLSVSASHDAYQDNFGYIHSRLIKIDKKSGNLLGLDKLVFKKSINSEKRYDLRFHLYPELIPVQTIGGNSILISIGKNKSLIFKTKEGNLLLEKSVFLGRNKIINNFCITISGVLKKNENKNIEWELKKSN